jgi:hypothetical protein
MLDQNQDDHGHGGNDLHRDEDGYDKTHVHS